jgi:hypothetical protein
MQRRFYLIQYLILSLLAFICVSKISLAESYLGELGKILIIPLESSKLSTYRGESIYDFYKKSNLTTSYQISGVVKIKHYSDHSEIASFGMDTRLDDELTCYRSCFGKLKKEDCGIYAKVHDNKKHAEKCPNLD